MPTKKESAPKRETTGRVRRVKRDEVRSRLLKAGFGVFAERGYEGASLERVAEAAGFSKGAVYSNFANKDELFFELVAARIDERAQALCLSIAKRAARRGPSSPRASEGAAAELARVAGRELREMGEADRAWQILFIEFWLRCARNEELRARLAEKRLAMRTKIAESVGSLSAVLGLSLGKGEAMDLATAILALSNGLGIEGIIDPAAMRPSLFGELLARIVIRRGPPSSFIPSALHP